ncbi:MAG: 16S rRNA (guanine(966)-N(2))-methyltransferase RsmD [Pyrinomonadaceae bacterium]
MRIITGQYRGRVLKSPPSMQIRPTSDRLRETLFNVIAARVEGARFLDLCAGSGAIGIEALSRGAADVTFVDRSRKMCGLVEANLDLCGVPEDQTEVVLSEAADYLRRRAASGDTAAWDVIFFDPPYANDYLPALEIVGAQADKLLNADGILVVEHHHKNALKDALGGISRWRIIKQGDSALSFFERQ